MIIGAGGTTSALVIDRVPVLAVDDGETPHLVVHASAPGALGDGMGGVAYIYRYLQFDLPAGHLSAALHIGGDTAAALDEGEVVHLMAAAAPQARPRKYDDPVKPWNLVDLPPADRQAAVESACAEFAGFDAYWQELNRSAEPLAGGLTELRGFRVEVVGEWPFTSIAVSFRHPLYPLGRLRRTLRVFDDAGRVWPMPYASIHLMEDLDTGALPPFGHARDGILEI